MQSLACTRLLMRNEVGTNAMQRLDAVTHVLCLLALLDGLTGTGTWLLCALL